MMNHTYRSCFLVTNNNDGNEMKMQDLPTVHIVNIYKYDKCNFGEAFLLLKPSKIFIEESRMCRMPETSEACGGFDFNGNTTSVGSDDTGNNKSLSMRGDNTITSISGKNINKFTTEDKLIDFLSLMSYNMTSTVIAVGENFHI